MVQILWRTEKSVASAGNRPPTARPSSLSPSLYRCAILDPGCSLNMSKTTTDLKLKFTYTKTKQADGILLYAVNTAICSVGTVNTTLRTRKIYNLLKSNKSKLILFNTSDSRYLYYVKYSHNLLTYSITIKMQ
jgi:hypothetical protein